LAFFLSVLPLTHPKNRAAPPSVPNT